MKAVFRIFSRLRSAHAYEYIVLAIVICSTLSLLYTAQAVSQSADTLRMTAGFPTPFAEYRILYARQVYSTTNLTNFVLDPNAASYINSSEVTGSLQLELGSRILPSPPAATPYYINLEPTGEVYVHSVRTVGRIDMGAPSAAGASPHADPWRNPVNLPGKHVYDVAEGFAMESVPAGTVVRVSADNEKLVPTTQAYDTQIAGVVSAYPRLYMGPGPDKQPLALTGIVLCRVSAENGPVHRGDMLVSAATAGQAMRADPERTPAGCIVGKALQSVESGAKQIYVLVNKQ